MWVSQIDVSHWWILFNVGKRPISIFCWHKSDFFVRSLLLEKCEHFNRTFLPSGVCRFEACTPVLAVPPLCCVCNWMGWDGWWCWQALWPCSGCQSSPVCSSKYRGFGLRSDNMANWASLMKSRINASFRSLTWAAIHTCMGLPGPPPSPCYRPRRSRQGPEPLEELSVSLKASSALPHNASVASERAQLC